MSTLTAITKEEYFEMLHKSDIKLEYHSGEVVAMAGAQPAHNIIIMNMALELGLYLKRSNCTMLSSDQLIKVEGCEKYTFPDLVIVCEEPIYERNPFRGLDALLNPNIIIEVLSDSTEFYDRTEKLECYKTIPSFTEYVLVASKKKKVEVYKKIMEDEWLLHEYRRDNEKVKIGDCEILFEDIYNKVNFETIGV